MKKYTTILIGLLICYTVSMAQTPAYQNPALTVDERVDDLVSRMTLEEKIFQLFNETPAIERLDVPAYNWWNECLHGVARAGKATVFPQAIGMAATFDPDLMFRIGTAVSDEARAKYHDFVKNNARFIYMGLTFWTPNINIFRDPRWGRGQETYGEDPFLTSRMAVNYIKGLQGDDPKYFKTIATAKHYAVHSGPEFSRHTDNIYVNNHDLYDTYLPAFEASVKEANVQSVMCAYNRFRDMPCCGSNLLLTNILRNDFGFMGYVVSDCGAISDFYKKGYHEMVENPNQAWGWSIAAGTDLNCEESKAFIKDNYEEAVRTGVLNEKDIDVSVKRLFKARFELGMFDPDSLVPYSSIPMSVVGCENHQKLNLEVAEKSLVLLKNDGILPLKGVKKVALVGPNANNPSILIGNYNGEPINPVTPLQGLRDKLGIKNVFYSAGCPIVPGVYTDYEIVGEKNLFHIENGKLIKGLKAEYFEDPDMGGNPKMVRVDKNIDFYWDLSPINQKVDEPYGVKWTGILVPEKSGDYQFSGNLKLSIDGKEITDAPVKLEKGKQYSLTAILKVSAFWWMSNHQQSFATLSWTDVSRDYQAEAMAATKNADVIIFCGGISSNLEGEEMKIETDGFAHGDRTNINLPKIQEDLLKELKATGKPIIYVNFSGSAIALNWQNENLSAIVQGFYPGELTGTALANLLYGDFNPSGRLPVTFYKSVDQLPDFKNYEMEGRTYRYFKGDALYPFGYGLSYTNFEYSKLKVTGTYKTGDAVGLSVDVKNTGYRDGEEVIQLYVSDKTMENAPIKALKAIQRISLKKGEQKTVSFNIKPEDFAVINNLGEKIIAPGKHEIFVGGSSNKTSNQSVMVDLTGKLITVQK